MQVHKFGEINRMIVKVIFGPLAVLYMKWHAYDHPLMGRICNSCIEVFKIENTLPFHKSIHFSFQILFKNAFKKIHSTEQQQLNYYKA